MIKKYSKQYNDFAEKFSDLHFNLDKLTNKYYYLQFKNLLKNKILLDLGCGEGKDLKFFSKKCSKVFGIDSSEEMIKLSKKNVTDAETKLGLFENIPFEESSFDIVCSKYALQSSKNIDKIYKQVIKVLKSDGYFIFLVVHPLRQFMEKKKNKKNYFKKEIVSSELFGGKIIVEEPTHTILEYLSPYFLKHFDIINFEEQFDPTNAELINGDKYPAFMIIKAKKRVYIE